MFLSIILLSLSLNGLPLDLRVARIDRGNIAQGLRAGYWRANPEGKQAKGLNHTRVIHSIDREWNTLKLSRFTYLSKLSYTWGTRIPAKYL